MLLCCHCRPPCLAFEEETATTATHYNNIAEHCDDLLVIVIALSIAAFILFPYPGLPNISKRD
jgi:hypothetical protein